MPRKNRLLSDLVHDSKIETEFFTRDVVQHVFYDTGRSARQRRVRNVERWTKGRQLGQGAYGTVHLQTCQTGGITRSRAVKEVKKYVIIGQELDYTSELEAIMKFSHSKYRHCFVISEGWYELEDTVFITMEYFELGDLQQYIATPLREPEAVQIVDQILEGLEFMHDNGFIHRDLKPANIMVVDKGPEWFVKIADFGISKRRHDETTTLTMRLGTLGFVAPEVIGAASDKTYTYSVDMWSLGAMAYRILTSVMAFQGMDSMFKYVHGMLEFPTEPLESCSVSKDGQDFVLKLMQADPKTRSSASSASNHPWITAPPSSPKGKGRHSPPIESIRRGEDSGISTASKFWSMNSRSYRPANDSEEMDMSSSPKPQVEPVDNNSSSSTAVDSNQGTTSHRKQASYELPLHPQQPVSIPEPKPTSESYIGVSVPSVGLQDDEEINYMKTLKKYPQSNQQDARDQQRSSSEIPIIIHQPHSESESESARGSEPYYKSPYVESDEDCSDIEQQKTPASSQTPQRSSSSDDRRRKPHVETDEDIVEPTPSWQRERRSRSDDGRGRTFFTRSYNDDGDQFSNRRGSNIQDHDDNSPSSSNSSQHRRPYIEEYDDEITLICGTSRNPEDQDRGSRSRSRSSSGSPMERERFRNPSLVPELVPDPPMESRGDSSTFYTSQEVDEELSTWECPICKLNQLFKEYVPLTKDTAKDFIRASRELPPTPNRCDPDNSDDDEESPCPGNHSDWTWGHVKIVEKAVRNQMFAIAYIIASGGNYSSTTDYNFQGL